MNTHTDIKIPEQPMTVEEFLAWAETLPREAGRFELWDGRVVIKRGPAGSMNAERSQHWEMKAALFIALRDAVRRAGIEAHAVLEGATVTLPPGTRGVEPDALVYLGPKVPRDALVVPAPIIVCEVLSPSTARHDTSAKLEGYFALASIEHYIIADPDSRQLIVHSRGAGPELLTRLVSDPEAHLTLDPPGLVLDLSEVLGG